MSKAGRRLIDAAVEAIQVARGEREPARITTFIVCADCGNVTKVEGGYCFVCKPDGTSGDVQRKL